MKTGSFDALGIEYRSLWEPRIFVANLGVLQLLVALGVLHFDQSILSPTLFGEWLLTSLVLFAGGISYVGYVYHLKGNKLEKFHVNFDDKRELGGDLTVSYEGSRGTKRSLVAVGHVKANPKQALMRQGGKLWWPVGGTASSLWLYTERPRLSLELGFSDPRQMDAVYEQLKDKGAPALGEKSLLPPSFSPPTQFDCNQDLGHLAGDSDGLGNHSDLLRKSYPRLFS